MLFDEGWTVYKDGEEEKKENVTLPDDRMIREKRDLRNPGGANISYFGGGKYIYEKEFEIHLKEGESAYFEFEGVYAHPTVYLNGQEAIHREYGYTDFIFEATPFLLDGLNHIQVIADNSEQPNSRWYSGSGIYRPVHFWILKKDHILPRSFKITPLDEKTGKVTFEAKFSTEGKGNLTVLDAMGNQVKTLDFEGKELKETLEIENPQLWDSDHPYLYKAVLTFGEDKAIEHFGIRTIKLDQEKGFLINGKREILYGACIHHDNGLLGAIDDEDAERRRARRLKACGYNAIRSAHNPISRYFLDEADKIGLLIMDEYADSWYIHKTKYDCASFVTKTYKEDLSDMVDKDYNHPSVILYSLGNEVAETSEKRGIEFVKAMRDEIHKKDTTRPITCGINIFFNALYSWGMGQYSDKKADAQARQAAKAKPVKKKKSVGSEFFNDLAGILGANFMKHGAQLHRSDVKTRGAFAEMDVAGYNYGIFRYKHDLRHYPNRFILGSETFCADAGLFYKMAQDNPRLIGDFVWAGWDYLGEAGVGSWVRKEDDRILADKSNWVLSGSGRIDILGHPSAEMYYTRTAFRLDPIALAVVSPKDYHYGHTPSAWKLSWAHRSYDFPGWEGKKTMAEIYSQCDSVALFQNGKCIGKKKKGKDPSGLYIFKIKYYPGELKAIGYDKDGKQTASISLKTGGDAVRLQAVPEKEEVRKDETTYIKLDFVDEHGQQKPLADKKIEITKLENCTLLGFGNACPYYQDTYLDNKTLSYYGRAQAIVRPLGPGKVTVHFHSECGDCMASLNAVDTQRDEDFHI